MKPPIDEELKKDHIVGLIGQTRQGRVDELQLVAGIYIEVGGEGVIDAQKNPVLIEPGCRALTNGIQVDENLVIGDEGKGRVGR